MDWYEFKDMDFHAYSAIYDARNISSSFRKEGPNVVVIGHRPITSKDREGNTYCGLWNDEHELVHTVLAEYHSDEKGDTVMNCPMGNSHVIPKFVSLELYFLTMAEKPIRIPIEISIKSESPTNTLLSLKSLYIPHFMNYQSLSPIRLVEWVELNQLLGVDHITAYIHSIHKGTGSRATVLCPTGLHGPALIRTSSWS